jgi:hypothetical protein
MVQCESCDHAVVHLYLTHYLSERGVNDAYGRIRLLHEDSVSIDIEEFGGRIVDAPIRVPGKIDALDQATVFPIEDPDCPYFESPVNHVKALKIFAIQQGMRFLNHALSDGLDMLIRPHVKDFHRAVRLGSGEQPILLEVYGDDRSRRRFLGGECYGSVSGAGLQRCVH